MNTKYSIDTRTLARGEVYVAIRGERYDGHDFVLEALNKGAGGLVLERHVDGIPDGIPVETVEDSEQHLCRLASDSIRKTRSQTIAITGSIGKTTTKNAVSTVLGGKFSVLYTPGNLNTPLGIALTVLNADIATGSKLVLEMGATRRGDIAHLCSFYPPQVSVVTNVYGVHLDSYGSVEAVASAKSEIVRALTAEGVACLNHDAPLVRAMAEVNAGRTSFYGRSESCDVRPGHITATVPLLGEHVIDIALSALAVGRTQGISDEEINRQLEQLVPESGRLNRLEGVNGCTLVDDTYNASPRSTEVALSVLNSLPARRRVAILGDMLELGAISATAHENAVNQAKSVADQLIIVGPLMGAVKAGEGVLHYHDSTEVVQALRMHEIASPQRGDVVLIKGSQGARMERISKALLHPAIDPASVLVRQSPGWVQV